MIVAFEGLTCVGKTSAIGRLAGLHSSSKIVSELVLAPPPIVDEGFYWRNDETKSQIVATTAADLILVDRYYPSTLAYGLATERGLDVDLDATRDELTTRCARLSAPDVWIVFECAAVDAFVRASMARPNATGLWTFADGLQMFSAQLEGVMQVIESSPGMGSVRRVDANRVFRHPELLSESIPIPESAAC